MTIEEQEKIKEFRKQLQNCEKNTNEYGFKAIGGFVYKFANGFAYTLNIRVPEKKPFSVYVILTFKPLVLDDLFWDIFEIKSARVKPKSFHIDGAFTAPDALLKFWENPINDDFKNLYVEILKEADNIINEYSKKINNLDAFQSHVKSHKYQLLNYILVEIYKKDYKNALMMLDDAIQRKDPCVVSFMDSDGKTFFEYAQDYCKGKSF